MTLLEYLIANRIPTSILRLDGDPHALRQVGQFAIGTDAYVVQLLSGNSVTIPDLSDMIEVICGEFRAAPNWDFEVFAGRGRVNNRSLFVRPREELGRPFGRNLRALRENLMLWTAHLSLTGELPPDVPRDNNTVSFRRYPQWI